MNKKKRIIFETEWFNIEEQFYPEIEAYRGAPYYRINCPSGVMVLAVTSTHKIILVEQFRPSINSRTLEFPSGFVDKNEDPLKAAARELLEETGYACGELILLGTFRMMLNRINSTLFVVAGLDARRDPQTVLGEDIQTILLSPAEVKELVKSGGLQQIAAIGALQLARWELKNPIFDI